MVRLRKLIPRFSLRTLAIFTLLCTSGTGLWWHWEPWASRLSFQTDDKESDILLVRFRDGGTLVEVMTGGFIVRETWSVMTECYEAASGRPIPLGERWERLSAHSDLVADADLGYGRTDKFAELAIAQCRFPDGRWLEVDIHQSWRGRYFFVATIVEKEDGPKTIYHSRRTLCRGNVRDIYNGPIYAAVAADGESLVIVLPDHTASIFRRRRPEWWWGVAWLPEFWLTALFAGLFVWSVVRDRRALRGEAA